MNHYQKLVIALFAFFLCIPNCFAYGWGWSIWSFKEVENAATITTLAEDGQPYALLKLVNALPNMKYYIDSLAVGNVEDRVNETWIYIRSGSETIIVADQNDIMQMNFRMSKPVESGKTYCMILNCPVDLGLSVNWACSNLGAEKPEDLGYPFAWGKTGWKGDIKDRKSCYYRENLVRKGITDKNGVLTPEHDAASHCMSSFWRMPTIGEILELKECKHKTATINGVKGTRVTGPNGNSIFLPNTPYYSAYWSSVTYERNTTFAQTAYVLSFNKKMSVAEVFGQGLYIRPVFPKKVPTAKFPPAPPVIDTDTIVSTTEFGYLILKSIPDSAEVWINGVLEGYTPFQKKYGMKTRLNITLKHKDYADKKEIIKITEKQNYITSTLKNKYAQIKIKTAAGATIVANGIKRDSVRWTQEPGFVNLEISKDGYKTEVREIELKEGDDKVVEVELKAILGAVAIESQPSGASVIIEGKYYGVTPCLIDSLPIGTRQLTLKRIGCYEASFGIVVSENKEETFSFSLDKDEKQMPEIVDLGLSVRWANKNLGATRPIDKGEFFKWGNIDPVSYHNKDRFPADNMTIHAKNKAELEQQGKLDGNGNLHPNYDAVTQNLGGNWRLPTLEEITELKEKCRWEHVRSSTNPGFRITGPSGNFIFLPYSKTRHVNGDATFWSSTPCEKTDNAYIFYLGQSLSGGLKELIEISYFLSERNIRPVTSDYPSVPAVDATTTAKEPKNKTNTTPTVKTQSMLIGKWKCTRSLDTYTFKSNGNGLFVASSKYASTKAPFTWKQTGNNITVKFSDGKTTKLILENNRLKEPSTTFQTTFIFTKVDQ